MQQLDPARIACLASSLHACFNDSGTHAVVGVETHREQWPVGHAPIEYYVQRPDTGAWERSAFNLPGHLHVKHEVWEPLIEWPDGWSSTE